MGTASYEPEYFAVIVTFKVVPGAVYQFLELVTNNARKTLEIEPECLQFDVLVPDTGQDSVVLYEVYASSSAFAHHLSRPHFARFDIESQPFIQSKLVTRLRRLQ